MPDQNGYLLPNERRILLQHYAPVLILFPENARLAPYPDDGDAIYTLRGSYHPRAVEFFLSLAKVRYRPKILLRRPGLLFKPRSYIQEIEYARQSVTRAEWEASLELYRHDPQYAGLRDADLCAALLTRLIQQKLAQHIRGFDLPYFRGHNLRQWKAYFKFLEQAAGPARRAVVYGRLVQGLAALGEKQLSPQSALAQISTFGPYDVSQGRVALQYWFQYYYDDWANRHEGDWESITILLDLDEAVISQTGELDPQTLLAGVRVSNVGYSSHEDGYRRLWQDVQKTRDGRPLVYVARGSSASYFAWQIDGYPTSARVGLVEKLLGALGGVMRGRRFLGRRWDAEFQARFTGRDPKNTDWVPADPEPLDRLDDASSDPLERLVPVAGRGVRRRPDFGPDAGHNAMTYHLETEDTFWLEMVQEYGIQWGERYFLPGTQGPRGLTKTQRDRQRQTINCLAQIENVIDTALRQLMALEFDPAGAIPELDRILRPLRPHQLRRKHCVPVSIRPYLHAMWAAVLRTHPEAWPGGPGLYLRWVFARQPKMGPLLRREDPVYHLKSLLAVVRRVRYENQHEGSKWDNPFAWVHYVCRADTFYYGIAHSPGVRTLDLTRLDCDDTPPAPTRS